MSDNHGSKIPDSHMVDDVHQDVPQLTMCYHRKCNLGVLWVKALHPLS